MVMDKRWTIRELRPSLMDVIVDSNGAEIIRVYKKDGVAEEIVKAHNATIDKPKKPSILGERWVVESSDDEYWIQTKEDEEIIANITAINKLLRAKQIAALPDLIRAAKEVVDQGFAIDLGILIRVLKKAGIHDK